MVCFLQENLIFLRFPLGFDFCLTLPDFSEKAVFDFFTFDDVYLVLFYIEKCRIVFYKDDKLIKVLENPFNPNPESRVILPDISDKTRFNYLNNYELIWYYGNTSCRIVDFSNICEIRIGKDIDVWGINVTREQWTIVSVIHHQESRRLVGLFLRLPGKYFIRICGIQEEDPETIDITHPYEDYIFFRGTCL